MWLLTTVALAFDPAPYAAVLDGAVQPTRVDYARLTTRKAALDAVVADLATAQPGATRDAQLAFWITAYDAITLKLVVDAGPGLASIRDLDGGKVWTTRTFQVAGQPWTLDRIENTMVRAFGDPRVHAALSCASRGCPPLPARPLTADGLDAQLDAAARTWVATNAYRIEGDRVLLSSIFDWYAADFTRTAEDVPNGDPKVDGAVGFLLPYVDAATAVKLKGAAGYGWIPYDWSLNR